jgi:hypothetical protein
MIVHCQKELYKGKIMSNILSRLIYFTIILIVGLSSNLFAHLDYLNSIKKIDVHVHIRNDAPYLREMMDDLNVKMITICTGGLKLERMNFQIDSAKAFSKKYPRYYGWMTTFDLTKRNDPDWTENTIAQLKQDFKEGPAISCGRPGERLENFLLTIRIVSCMAPSEMAGW